MFATTEVKSYKTSWIVLLALLTAIAPLSTDMYLPALPQMAADYAVSTLTVSSSLPAYFLGLAIGQLIYGPISDRIGRKKPLIFGLVLHIVTSLWCIYVDDLNSLLLLRVLQALGSCVGLVLARAAIRDVLDIQQAAKAFASMMIVMGIAPVIAPTLGAWILLFFHWQAIFVALALLGVLGLMGVLFKFEETLAQDRRLKLTFNEVGKLYLKILADRSFLYPMLAGCFSFAVLFCYINAASTILMEYFHLNQQQFAYVFGLNAIGTIILSSMNHKLEHKYSVVQRLKMGGMVQAIGAGLLIIACVIPQLSFILCMLGLFFAVAAIGFTAPNSTALAMSQQGRQAGSASALMGSIQFAFGLLSGVLITVLFWSTLTNLAMCILVFVVLSNMAISVTMQQLKTA